MRMIQNMMIQCFIIKIEKGRKLTCQKDHMENGDQQTLLVVLRTLQSLQLVKSKKPM